MITLEQTCVVFKEIGHGGGRWRAGLHTLEEWDWQLEKRLLLGGGAEAAEAAALDSAFIRPEIVIGEVRTGCCTGCHRRSACAPAVASSRTLSTQRTRTLIQ